MSHNYAKGHITGKKNMWRKNIEVSMMLQQKLSPFEDHPYPPKTNMLEKLS